MAVDLTSVPEAQRAAAQAALEQAFPAGDIDDLVPGPTGASGASTYRVIRRAGDHLLRVEGSRLPGRNPHQYRNLRVAAEAGLAPPVRVADDDLGLLVMTWIEARPLGEFPGGPGGLVRGAAELIVDLQRLEPFPKETDWLEMLGHLLAHVADSGRFAPGVLAPHADAYDRIMAAWPRDAGGDVAAHNDPNANNILFDGQRLWLVDWETSAPNDPVIDLAVVANQLAPTSELRDDLLAAWKGAPPDDHLRARLTLAQLATQLFAGCMIALVSQQPGAPPEDDLAAPSPDEFKDMIIGGQLAMGTPETMNLFAKVVLSQYLAVVESDEFDRALRQAAG